MSNKNFYISSDTISVIRSVLCGHCSSEEIKEIVRRVNGWEKVFKALEVASGFISSRLDGQNSEWEECGLCEGTGLLTPWRRGLTLKFINEALTEAGEAEKEN